MLTVRAPADDPQPAVKKEAARKAEPDKAAAENRAAALDAKKADEKKKVDNRTIQRKLRTRTDLKADKLPLKDVVKQLSELHEIPIRLDEAALKKAGVSPDKPITVSIENFTLALALKHVLKDLNIHYGVVNGEIVIGDPPPAEPEPAPAAAAPVAAEAVIEALPAMMQLNPGGGEAMVQQFKRQYQGLLKAELHLVRSVCQPTDEQWQRITDELDQTLKTKLEQFQNDQKKIARQQRGGQMAVGDPLQFSRTWVHKAVKAHLTSEQAAQFQEQVDKRAADRRDAALHNVVARLDQDLVLSTAQRDQITAKLRENWKDQWCPSPSQFIQMEQWFPNIPDPYIVDFLDPAQKEIWKSTRTTRNNGVVFAPGVFNGFMGGMFGQEVLWNDEEAEGKPNPEPVREGGRGNRL